MATRKAPKLRSSPVVLMLALAVYSAAGCGGGNDTSTGAARAEASVALGPVVDCLRRTVRNGRVTTSQRALDQIAGNAQRGAAVVRFEVSSIAPKGTNIA